MKFAILVEGFIVYGLSAEVEKIFLTLYALQLYDHLFHAQETNHYPRGHKKRLQHCYRAL